MMRESSYLAVPLTLHDETRKSLVPHVSIPIKLSVDIPPRSVLRFAIAAATSSNPEFPLSVEFKVTLRDNERQETLFREQLRRSDRNRWLDREVGLGSWAGTKAQLVLDTRIVHSEGAPSSGYEDVFPVWGSPIVTGSEAGSDIQQMILISIDCLRADHVGVYGYERNTTPNIDAFARDGVVFETAISTSATTLPTHMSMFTGLTPSEHGANNRQLLSRAVPYLPELLASAGFQVDAVVSGAYLSQYFGFERGFHSYLSLHQPLASETIDAALRVLERTEGSSRFLFLHVIDPHWPYSPPGDFAERYGPVRSNVDRMLHKVLMQIPPDGPAEVAQAVDLYDLEVAYADREVGRFLEELKARDVYEDSLIILTADHGEAFYEHGSWQHGWTLYEENVHVPLIVKWPGNSRRGRTKQLVSQVDIFATLLEQAAVASPHSRSTSLTALAAPETSGLVRRHAVSEFITNPSEGETPYKKVSLRTEARKYIVTFRIGADELAVGEITDEEIYDLTRDPGELQNLIVESQSEADSLRRGIHAYLQDARAHRSGSQGATVNEDDTIRERLRSLGYLTSP